jgi:hypothetical protein
VQINERIGANHNDVYDKKQGNEVDKQERTWRECTSSATSTKTRRKASRGETDGFFFLILGETDMVGRGWIPRVHFFDSYGTLFHHFDVLTECNYCYFPFFLSFLPLSCLWTQSPVTMDIVMFVVISNGISNSLGKLLKSDDEAE